MVQGWNPCEELGCGKNFISTTMYTWQPRGSHPGIPGLSLLLTVEGIGLRAGDPKCARALCCHQWELRPWVPPQV